MNVSVVIDVEKIIKYANKRVIIESLLILSVIQNMQNRGSMHTSHVHIIFSIMFIVLYLIIHT